MSSEDEKGRLIFPCEYALKIIGSNSQVFEEQMLVLLRQHFPMIGEGAVKLRLSSEQKYLALSVTLWVEHKETLDNLYQELSTHPLVLFAL